MSAMSQERSFVGAALRHPQLKRLGNFRLGVVGATSGVSQTDLVQRLIRNACVNDGTPASGNEVRSVDLIESYLRVPGVEMKRYEPVPGRASQSSEARRAAHCRRNSVPGHSLPAGWARPGRWSRWRGGALAA